MKSKNSSRCWVWLPRGFLIIKLDTVVWTTRPCRNSTSFSLRLQRETEFSKLLQKPDEVFLPSEMPSDSQGPIKDCLVGLVVKIQEGDQENILACKWHHGQNASAQCREREMGKPCLWQPLTKLLSKNASIKCQEHCWKVSSWRTPSLPGYPVHFSSTEVNFKVLTSCLGIMWKSNTAMPAHVPKKC